MSDDERVVPLHPAAMPEVSPEERAHRLKVEVERLARLPTAEWMLYVVGTEGYAERYGVDRTVLKQMVEAVIPSWEPDQTVRFPESILPEEIRLRLTPGVRLLAYVNIGETDPDKLVFRDFRLAPQPTWDL